MAITRNSANDYKDMIDFKDSLGRPCEARCCHKEKVFRFIGVYFKRVIDM